MSREICKDITELFPQFEGVFPSVGEILETTDDYDYNFYTNNPKPFAIRLIKSGFLPRAVMSHWKDQIVIDLGCGRQTNTYGIACIAGAKAYVPIDKYHIPRWIEKFVEGKDWKVPLEKYKVETGAKVNRVPVYPIYGDMCQVLEMLPDDSVGILIAGIDRIIVSESEKTSNGKNRLGLLLTEIPRVLSPTSSCTSFMSYLDFENLKIDEDHGKDLKIFIK